MAEIVDKMPQNEPTEKAVRTQSTFPLSHYRKLTARFGEYTPFFNFESVERDKIPLRVSHDVRSFTLKSPLMSDLRLKKDYFQVPMEAILPRNWDKIYTNPVIGDDVPVDANCASDLFWPAVLDATSAFMDYINDWSPVGENVTAAEASDFLTRLFNFLLFCELFYSNGSLIKYCDAMPEFLFKFTDSGNDVLGADTSPCVLDFDLFEELVFTNILGVTAYFDGTVNGVTYHVNCKERYPDVLDNISFREFLNIARDQGYIDGISFRAFSNAGDTIISALYDVFMDQLITLESSDQPSARIPFNWSRCAAYQLVCYHYYSNDHVDYIYSSQLYREYLESLFNDFSSSGDLYLPYFVYNGVGCQYDILSAYAVLTVFSELINNGFEGTVFESLISFLRALFGFNASLRFVDYFTGSKAYPLAVGDVSINTSGSSVSVVDVTRNIQRQRFLNSINRTGRKISEYVKGLFGVSQAPDWHNPFFLAHVDDAVITSEIENTADAQISDPVSVTSVMRGNSSKYAFEFECDRRSVLIGILYFDIPRDYYQGVDRLTMHLDRFDMFNPYMQFIGDQPIYNAELTSNKSDAPMTAFGYQMRHAEYKQAVNRAVGGFIDFLPGWTFLADRLKSYDYIEHIGPSYIRSNPSELDDFYVALGGYSLAGYFHFIISLYFDCDASRPMAFAPTIL